MAAQRRSTALGLVLVAAGLAGCSTAARGHSIPGPRAAPPAVVPATAEVSFAFEGSPPSNWNPLAAGASGSSEALGAVADQVLPSVFSFGPTLDPQLNTSLVESAREVSNDPQTVVYRINPKATWSDGTPFTGADFLYNWQAQSGRRGLTDVGGKPFAPATTAGYDLIQMVTVSPATPDLVTVVFSQPYPDWPTLFHHMVPAHTAEKIGFDDGFTNPVADLVSAGPFVVVAYDPSGTLHLVRNPSWWGPPASALELDFRFVPDQQRIFSALLNAQVDCAELSAIGGVLLPAKELKGLDVMVAPGASFLDLELNQAAGPFRSNELRASLMAAISRRQVVTAVAGSVAAGEAPPANRFLVPGEAGYSANGLPPSSVSVTPALALLTLAAGPEPPVQAAARAVARQLEEAGYAVKMVLAGAPGPSSGWDLAVVERTISPAPGAVLEAYASGSPTNTSGISDPALDAAITQAQAAQGSRRMALIDRVDQLAWADHADLPLAFVPQVVVCRNGVSGPAPNPSPDGPAYDASSWVVSPRGS